LNLAAIGATGSFVEDDREGWFGNMPATDDYVRSPKSMHKVFCASAVILALVTFWMMWADYNDEWRTFQREAFNLQAQRIEAREAKIKNDPEFQKNVAELEEQVTTAKSDLQAHSAEEKQLGKKAKEAKNRADAFLRDLKTRRAQRDVARADYNLGVRDSVSNLQDLETNFKNIEADVQQREVEYVELTYESEQAKAALGTVTARRDMAQADLKAAETEINMIHTAVQKIDPQRKNWDGQSTWWDGTLRRAKLGLMQLPIVDGFNGRERIAQDWMPKLEIDLGGMTKVSRFDRCRTCHAMIDSVDVGTSPAFPEGSRQDGKYPQPYASHPRLDLYLTSASPHPLPKFGCTVCHEGQGSGTSLTNASHTPNDPVQKEEWEHQYKWFDNHFWEHPMYPKRFQESGCIKCHINVVELGVNDKFGPTAPNVHRGYELVKTYGCFGCHEISGFDGTKVVGPDLRLEPSTPEEAEKIANDPLQVAGKMRKVGPSLRHNASKSEPGFVAYWTEEPKRFRPTTRMPQFFHLDNQQDHLAQINSPIEIAAVAHYLQVKSKPFDTLSPAPNYKPDATRGQELFATRGCVVCHSHSSIQGIDASFGPELSRISDKLKAGKAGFDWLYTWIREPERYHPRTKMPHLFIDQEGTGDNATDPAADIAAFLLKMTGDPANYKPTATYAAPQVDEAQLDGLIESMLAKSLTKPQIAKLLKTGQYPIPKEKIKTDEIELVGDSDDFSPEEWKQRKLTYVGRKTITKYGCYGCHDIPNYESARPIGTGLADWGKKDRSRLAFEHIHEYLHHHGNADLGVELEALDTKQVERLKLPSASGVRVSGIVPGHPPEGDHLQLDDVIISADRVTIQNIAQLRDRLSRTVVGSEMPLTIIRNSQEQTIHLKPDGSMIARAERGIGRAERGEFKTEKDEDRELSVAYYVESLSHHGRPGFLWQKLRQPRSYDYKTVETKSSYDDRLRMPKFPFSEDEIDAIATFILGLTAEPPVTEYIYNPAGKAGAKIRGTQLIEQYNCSGCHVLDLPKIRYGADVDALTATDTSSEYPEAVNLLMALRPPRNGLTGEKKAVKVDGARKMLPVMEFHGLVISYPNPDDAPEDQEYVVELWENLKAAGKNFLPTTKFIFPAANLESIEPAEGGRFAEWLVNRLVETKQAKEKSLAWQMSPPPLYKEGTKVQTPWLFNFLRNPGKLRHTTVLRMPRFNMSDDEAQALANYFAAMDGTQYPYQLIAEREPRYVEEMDAEFHKGFPDKKDDYLGESWKMLNAPLCIKCHSVGGQQVKISNPATDIRGPNLDLAADRLRPDWTLLWLYKPAWITPYTSMPQPLPPMQAGAQPRFPDLFGDNGQKQTVALRDALMNYHKLLEREGKASPSPTPPAANAGGND
jgi:mono/diheme cytochrome c family protein